jgi:hypothetical protein
MASIRAAAFLMMTFVILNNGIMDEKEERSVQSRRLTTFSVCAATGHIFIYKYMPRMKPLIRRAKGIYGEISLRLIQMAWGEGRSNRTWHIVFIV